MHLENGQQSVVRTTGDEPVSRETTMWGTRVKHWSNAMLLHPGDKTQHPCPLLTSASVSYLKDLSPGTTSCEFPWRLPQTLSHSHNMIICHDWPWPATATINYHVHFPSPRICPGGALLWVWLERSVWKVPPKLSLSLDNWFRRETGLNNLDPFLHGLSCCLVHWSWEIKLWSSNYLPGNRSPG